MVTGKASHQLDPNCYEVKKKASWKQKPPLVTVRVFPPGANGEEKAEKVEGMHNFFVCEFIVCRAQAG